MLARGRRGTGHRRHRTNKLGRRWCKHHLADDWLANSRQCAGQFRHRADKCCRRRGGDLLRRAYHGGHRSNKVRSLWKDNNRNGPGVRRHTGCRRHGWLNYGSGRVTRLCRRDGVCRRLIQPAENFNGVGQHFRGGHRPRVAGFARLHACEDRVSRWINHRISCRISRGSFLGLRGRGKKRSGSHQQLCQPGSLVIDFNVLDVRCRANAVSCHQHCSGRKCLCIRLTRRDRGRLAIGNTGSAFGGVCCV